MEFLEFLDRYKKHFPEAIPEQVNEAFQVSNEHSEEMNEIKKKVRFLEVKLYKTKYTITVSHEVGKNVLDITSIFPNEILSFLTSETPISIESLDLSLLQQHCDNKSKVQKKFMEFFDSLKEQTRYSIIDTLSSNWLKDPIRKIDISIVNGSQVLWAHLVFTIKIKYSLYNTTIYHEAVGQLLVEFIYTNLELQLKRSDLMEFNITKPTGIQMLLNLISLNLHQLSYSPPENHKMLI
ncbi:9112_t:CDS:2, partial [Funneliformis caledonium]